MKFKLDENLSARLIVLFTQAGHHAETVAQEELSGASDARLFEVCCAEDRCLITLDLDFADVLRFPPRRTPGIAVLRPPKTATSDALAGLLQLLMSAVQDAPIAGRLWVVQVDRIRVYEEPDSAVS
jgi:predicted nuclease of predicted toxin-antitoxin system